MLKEKKQKQTYSNHAVLVGERVRKEMNFIAYRAKGA